jgi:hypothetical protein
MGTIRMKVRKSGVDQPLVSEHANKSTTACDVERRNTGKLMTAQDKMRTRCIALILVTPLLDASPSSTLAQPSNGPANEINCNDFTKQGPDAWFADGIVHLKIDGTDITYNNSTIRPGMKTASGVDVYAYLESTCGGH